MRHEYVSGESVDIKVLGFTADGESLLCRVVGEDSSVRGPLVNEELIKGVWTKDIIDYFFEDDCVRGAVLYRDEYGYSFSIADAYTSYARRQAEKELREGLCFRAKVYNVNEEWGRVNWITPSGYGGISKSEDTPGVKVGDTAVLQVLNVQKQGANTYINLCYPKYGVDSVRPFSEDNDILGGFVTTEEELKRSRDEARSTQSDKGRDTLRVLSSILSSTSSRETSIDSYRLLLVALFLSSVVDDKESVESLRAEAYYLGQCIAFAQGDPVITVRGVALSETKQAVIRVLSHWDSLEGDVGKELIEAAGSTLPGRIASLLLGVRISDEFQDEVSADREVVRRKICTLLGVEDAFMAEGSIRKGKYGVAEGHEVEFKSSYVFRNDGKGPDIDYQGRGQVFEAVCAFLNADGGVLYLGVSDAGDPIVSKDYGLSADMTWLTEHYNQINQKRIRLLGHPVPTADNLDHYVLFLNAEKELYFKESLQGNITIEVTEDGDAIRMTVAPAEYEIAYLYSDRTRSDGVAYVRDGGRTLPMSRVQKEQRLAALKHITKEMGFVVAIQEAIDRHQRIIFKDYASGNSGEVRDRYVVPINLFYNDENVFCLDLDAKTYKQFRLHRIGAVEPSEDTSPYTLPVSEPKEADVFRWVLPDGERSYHVRLRLDVASKNYLLEEYSCADKLPKEEFYEEEKNKWILDTHVNGLGAVRRFYLGLADRIEILDTEDSEELKKDIAEYVKKNIG
jgi:predicted DNA-binding transcriptional regulator YafY